MQIAPATMDQVRAARNGRMVTIDADVGDYARRLREIDPGLRLRYSESGGYFAVYHEQHGTESLVFTASELDGRVLDRMERIASEQYDYTAEVARKDAEAEKAIDDRFGEQVGEAGERLAWAIREDLGDHTRDRARLHGTGRAR